MLATAKTMLEALQQTIDLLKDTQLSESELSPPASVEATPPPLSPWEANRDLATNEVKLMPYCSMYTVQCSVNTAKKPIKDVYRNTLHYGPIHYTSELVILCFDFCHKHASRLWSDVCI